ncbi:MAG TPA: hypothetical protein VMB34_20835 [Acetobacteraceae bacterium]|nr:hypothetical protein [Acetobacteraceae bacterium]
MTGASYTDSFAQSNPGAMYLDISDSAGLLSAYYPGSGSGTVTAPGAGTDSITFQGSYADVAAIINSLTYAATTAGGSDSIAYDIWNQAGVETTGSIPVTIGGGSGGITETWTGAVGSDWNTAGNWSGNAVPTSGDTVVIAPNATTAPSLANAMLSGETIILGSSSPTGPSVLFNDVTLGAGTTLESSVSGGSVGIDGTLTVAAGATISADGAPFGLNSSSTSPAVLVNDGVIVNSGSGLVAMDDVVYNNGAMLDSNPSGGMEIGDGYDIFNSGTIIAQGGLIQLDGATNGTVAFAGSGGTVFMGVVDTFGTSAIVTGFGSGDRILSGALAADSMSYSDGRLALDAGPIGETIPFAGTLGLGNFELNNTQPGASPAFTSTVFYAASGTTAGTDSGEPDIAAPGTASVAAGGTLVLNDVSIANAATLGVDISATNGRLSMNGASGNGTDHLTIAAGTPASQVNADLASLTYVPAGGAGSEDIEVSASAPFAVSGTTDSIRYIPVNISAASSGPTLNEPAGESVTTGGSIPVPGSYSDSFAAGNPGSLYLGISDGSGTLYGYYPDASGHAVTGAAAGGSGTNALSFSGSYSDVEDILNSLTYVAGSSPGSDSINFEIWNQAGVETTGSVAVTVTAGTAGGGMAETWTGAVSSDWNTAANWSGNAVPTSGDTVLLFGDPVNVPTLSNAILSGETLVLQSSGNVAPVLDFNDVTLNSVLETATTGFVNVGGTLTIGAQGTVMAEANGWMSLDGTGEVVANNGLIASAPSGSVVFYDELNQPATGTLINNGTLLADGSIVLGNDGQYSASPPYWDVTNSGSIEIGNGGFFNLNGTLAGGSIAYNGPGSLELEQPNAFQGATVTGFGQGDALDLDGYALGTVQSFSNGTLYLANSSGTEAVPLTGNFVLGNFQEADGGTPFTADTIGYAPGGGTSGVVGPGIVTPAQDTVAQGATLVLNDVSIVATNGGTIANTGTYFLSIDAGAGTLFMTGGSGSGTGTLSASGTAAQLNADLSNLSYVPGAGASADTVGFHVVSGEIVSNRWLPITVTGSVASGPTLNEPTSESVTAGGTVAVGGSYADSFAQRNPGQLYIGISDSSGALTATNAAGQAVAGSGSNQIGVSADYVDANAILASLHYTAGGNTGSDTISFEVWNQAGVETTGATAVTIGGGTPGASMTMADFAASSASAGSVVPAYTGGGSMNLATPDPANHPIGMPLALHSGW